MEYAECPVSIPRLGMIYWRIDVRSDSLTFVATACSRRRYEGGSRMGIAEAFRILGLDLRASSDEVEDRFRELAVRGHEKVPTGVHVEVPTLD